MDLKLSGISWRPAKGKDLSDHCVGDICLDSAGAAFLIGQVEVGADNDVGCGCCSERFTEFDIVSYYPALNIIL